MCAEDDNRCGTTGPVSGWPVCRPETFILPHTNEATMSGEEKDGEEHAKEIKQHEAAEPAPRGGAGGRDDDERLIETPPPHPA